MRDLSNLDMLITTLNGLSEKYNLSGLHIDEVVGGAVVTHSKDWNLAREAVIGSNLAASTPGTTMMQACGTSLQAAMGLASKIALGEIDSAIAVGSDTTSDAPIVFSKKFSKRLVDATQRKGTWSKLGAFKGMGLGELAPKPPSVAEPRTGLSMGQHCELMAQEWRIPRDEQDQLAMESHAKAAAAYREGYMDDLLGAVRGCLSRQQSARGHGAGQTCHIAQRLRALRSRDTVRCQFNAVDRRRRRRPARVRRLGQGSRPAHSGLSHDLSDRGQQLRRW